MASRVNYQANSKPFAVLVTKLRQLPRVACQRCGSELDFNARELTGSPIRNDEIDLSTVAIPEVRELHSAFTPGSLLRHLCEDKILKQSSR